MRPERITEQRSLPGEAMQASEPKVRMSEWFDAMRENSKAFVKMAMTDCQAGPTWQPVIERILTNAYEMGYKAGMDAQKQQASNDKLCDPHRAVSVERK